MATREEFALLGEVMPEAGGGFVYEPYRAPSGSNRDLFQPGARSFGTFQRSLNENPQFGYDEWNTVPTNPPADLRDTYQNFGRGQDPNMGQPDNRWGLGVNPDTGQFFPGIGQRVGWDDDHGISGIRGFGAFPSNTGQFPSTDQGFDFRETGFTANPFRGGDSFNDRWPTQSMPSFTPDDNPGTGAPHIPGLRGSGGSPQGPSFDERWQNVPQVPQQTPDPSIYYGNNTGFTPNYSGGFNDNSYSSGSPAMDYSLPGYNPGANFNGPGVPGGGVYDSVAAVAGGGFGYQSPTLTGGGGVVQNRFPTPPGGYGSTQPTHTTLQYQADQAALNAALHAPPAGYHTTSTGNLLPNTPMGPVYGPTSTYFPASGSSYNSLTGIWS